MSTLSIGSLNQLGDAFEGAGWTAEDVTKLKQFKDLNGIKAILNGQAEIFFLEKKWFEVDGVIYLKVISDGATGEQWIERLEKQDVELGDYAKELLLSKDFNATTGTVYTIAVLKDNLFTDNNRVTKKIRSEAKRRKLATPNPEVACLIREMFSDDEIEAMNLVWIVVFHKPITDSYGDSDLLIANLSDDYSRFSTYYENPKEGWGENIGFAFEVSRISI